MVRGELYLPSFIVFCMYGISQVSLCFVCMVDCIVHVVGGQLRLLCFVLHRV